MLTDTHTHLTATGLADALPQVLRRARQAGVGRFLVPATGRSDWQTVLDLAGRERNVFAAVGIHPWFAAEHGTDDLAALAALLAGRPEIWLGECGLDYLHAATEEERAVQRQMLAEQLALAVRFRRPVLLHNVRAGNDLAVLLKQMPPCGGIVHAFSGSLEEAHVWIRLGLHIGIGSLLLNPKAKKVRRAAAELPLHNIVLETDSPYMLAGAVNEPANLRRIAEAVCALRGITLPELAEACEHNWQTLRQAAERI